MINENIFQDDSDPSILSQEKLNSDERPESNVRPQTLSDFKGQKELKDNINIFIQAAKERQEALDHIFISGPPGLGKTTLANIVAHELETELKVSAAPILDKPKDLAGILTTLSENSIFFIDEIHRLRPAVEEMLYVAMEDFELDWIIGQGPAARTVRIPLPHFTLIGATTKPGKVSTPLYTRFGITQRISYYEAKELEEIIARTAELLNINIEKDAIALLANCSRGTPRVANRLLRRIRDFGQMQRKAIISSDLVESSLQKLRVDKIGLEELDRIILATIIENYGGGPVGAETLAISVGEGIDTIEDFYEPYLIQRGFLQRTPRGRIVTDKAYSHLNLTRKINGNQEFLF